MMPRGSTGPGSGTAGSKAPARLAGTVLGLGLDVLAGEPPASMHPLRAFGRLMAWIERLSYDDERLAGARYAAVGALTGVASGMVAHLVPHLGMCLLARRATQRGARGGARALGAVADRSAAALPGPGRLGLHREQRSSGLAELASPGRLGLHREQRSSGLAELASTAGAVGVATGAHALWEAASALGEALEAGDLELARAHAGALVGRDVDDLGEADLARAAVESVGENTGDAIVGTLLWGAVLGAPGALGYRAVNTLDALVGYHSDRYERFGWASARLDDMMNLAVARCVAILVALARPHRARQVLRAVARDAPAHPSPNAGVAEAAFAAALGVRLGGVNQYGGVATLLPTLGEGPAPVALDVARAVELSSDVTALAAGVLLLLAGASALLSRLSAAQSPAAQSPAAQSPAGGS